MLKTMVSEKFMSLKLQILGYFTTVCQVLTTFVFLFSLKLQKWSARDYEKKAASTAPSSKLFWLSPERRDTGRCTAAWPRTSSDRFLTLLLWCAPTRWWSTCSAASKEWISPFGGKEQKKKPLGSEW